ncbi:alpha/beta hydrolase domain-containing protein [Poseidonocella sp. HB161398]|uniref:alpha/beta hydrolase domain-containing protein n=1 Tax=Poseidonocella sp. HB161398 TaxID=2320855 RepID=UPI00110A01A9|nr:alpha/beta hydrolase domain-containing protein [Poseidonocella sp. HB161398]
MIRPALLAGTALLALAPGLASAKVTEFEILAAGPAFDGQVFGTAGSYERIDAIATIAIDPGSDRAAGIADIGKVPVNDDGLVEFRSEVAILRPTGTGSGMLFYEVVNRGRNLSFQGLNLSPAGSGFDIGKPGDGFLMNRGHVLVWSGWQTHLGEELLNLDLPVAEGVTGLSREQAVFDDAEPSGTMTLTYPPADMDPAKAVLTVRATPDAPRETPEGLSFRYVDGTAIEISRPAGYDGGAIYDFVYPATGAVPAGLGFVATADIVSFLRGSGGHDAASPLGPVEHTLGIGISQSGRFMRDLIYQGFNADGTGARVFDGAIAHIAGSRKTYTNYPFALAGRYSRQHEDHDYPGDQFPFTYAETTDPLTGRTGSILDKCQATETCPKLMHTDTDTEFWQGRSSLVSTAPDGTPLDMPDTVRLYYLAGAPHFNSWGGSPAEVATCDYMKNPLSAAPVLRALEVALEDWVAEGTAPPDSVFPGLGGTGLVSPAGQQMPQIDGTRPAPQPNPLNVMDHGSTPPVPGAAYDLMVPELDSDGIALVGVKLPRVAVPTGSYMGWNLRSEGFAEGDLCSLTGSFVPFPVQEDARDSRAPLSARYADDGAYRARLAEAAEALVGQRLLLAADAALVVEAAPPLDPAAQ